MSRPPRSAYIHVPFCSHRCGYCNFTLVAGRDDLMSAFLEAIELEMARTLVHPREVDTLFLGGGTPTHLPPELLGRLLETLARWLRPVGQFEFSCEANPLDCDRQRLRILADAGVNRLSLGGQSFSDRKLKVLERDHSGLQLRHALAECAATFDNLSLDLIFAAPQETLREWERDLELAMQSPVHHLSTYGLTIERGSAFFGRTLRRELCELEPDLQLAMYQHTIDSLTQHHWEHYEVSSFAHAGYRCRHNQAYWLGEPWWAFGPGAASFTANDQGVMVRAVNQPSTTGYLKRVLSGDSAVKESEPLSIEERVRERLVFGLRQLGGVDLLELDQLLGQPAQPLFEPYVTEYVARGWLEWDARELSRLRLTRDGLMISDSLWPDLLAPRKA